MCDDPVKMWGSRRGVSKHFGGPEQVAQVAPRNTLSYSNNAQKAYEPILSQISPDIKNV